MKKTMHSMWKDAYIDQGSFVDSYFHVYFKEENNRVLQIDGDVEASLQVHPKALSLHGKLLKSSYLVSCIGSLSDRRALVSSVLDEVSESDLITLIQTDRTEDYESLGFETVIESRIYNMASSSLPDFPLEGIILDPKNDELINTYDSFSRHFTGYFKRSDQDFTLMKKHLRNQNGSIIGLVEEGKLVGYACTVNHGSYVEVLEVCYDKSGTLMRLLSFVSRGVSRIVFHASEAEQIKRIFPEAKSIKKPFIMARVNDRDLFERLYHIKIISAYSAFNAFGVPLFNRDFL